MAYPNVIALQRAQAKIQAARGTGEATMTHWMTLLSPGSTITIEQEHTTTQETTNSFFPYSDNQLGHQRCRLALSFVGSYERMPWWFQHIIKSQAMPLAGVTTGSTPPGYTYTIEPSANTDDIAVSTWKVGDGSTVYKVDRAVVNTLTIACNPQPGGDPEWRCTAEIFGIFAGTTTFDAPVDETLTKIVSYGTKVFIDAIGGTIGTTELTNRWRTWSITFTLNIEEKSFGALTAHTDFGRGYYDAVFEIVMEHTDDVWFAGARANTAYKIRFEKTGPNIGATPATDYRVRIDFNRAKLRIPTFSFMGQNKVATFGGFAEKPAATAAISTATVNALVSLTA
jgi:hypothetical protein